jgi:hypothetical protein
MASPLSNAVKPITTGATMGRETAGAGPALAAAEEADVAEVGRGPALVGGPAEVAGARVGAALGTATGAAVAVTVGGAPGASVGSFMVGAEVGLGGRLMRTVSFLGWTLDSAGLGGIWPPLGDVGALSDIYFLSSPPT